MTHCRKAKLYQRYLLFYQCANVFVATKKLSVVSDTHQTIN